LGGFRWWPSPSGTPLGPRNLETGVNGGAEGSRTPDLVTASHEILVCSPMRAATHFPVRPRFSLLLSINSNNIFQIKTLHNYLSPFPILFHSRPIATILHPCAYQRHLPLPQNQVTYPVAIPIAPARLPERKAGQPTPPGRTQPASHQPPSLRPRAQPPSGREKVVDARRAP